MIDPSRGIRPNAPELNPSAPGGFPEPPLVLIVPNLFGGMFPHHGGVYFVRLRVASTTSLPNRVTPVVISVWMTVHQYKPRRRDLLGDFFEVISTGINANVKNVWFLKYLGRRSLNPF